MGPGEPSVIRWALLWALVVLLAALAACEYSLLYTIIERSHT